MARALLRELQVLARRRGVRVDFRSNARGFYVAVDGSLFEIQALVEASRPFLAGLSMGFPRPAYKRARRAICERVLGPLAVGCDDISASVQQAAELLDGVPHSYKFDVGGATHLAGSVKAFSRLLILYHNGEVAPVHLCEAAHTAIETLLRQALGRDARGKSFEGMTRAAAGRGYVKSTCVEAILELKNLRRGAKHRAQGIRPVRLVEQLIEPVICTCHDLVKTVRSKRGVEEATPSLHGV